MLAKLVAVILAFGCFGGGLLALRQSRLQAAHELAAARWRIEAQREELARLRAEIAARSEPDHLRALLRAHPDLAANLASAAERRGTLRTPGPMVDPETGRTVRP